MNCKRLIPIALSVMMASSYIPTALADDALQESIDAKTETLLLFEDNFNDEKGDNLRKRRIGCFKVRIA